VTYIIDQTGNIAWSFIDNVPGIRADPADFLLAIPGTCKSETTVGSKTPEGSKSPEDEVKNGATVSTRPKKRNMSATFHQESIKNFFGKK
jgi:hypothetical protein